MNRIRGRAASYITVLVGFTLAFILANFLPYPYSQYVSAALLLPLAAWDWTTIISWNQRRQQAGPLLLGLGRLEPSLLVLWGLNAAAFGIGATVRFLADLRKFSAARLEFPWQAAALAILALSSLCVFIAACRSRIEIRQQGVGHFPKILPWDHIAAYRIHHDFAQIKTETGGVIDFDIDGPKKESLRQILRQYLPALAPEAGESEPELP